MACREEIIINHYHVIIVQMTITFDSTAFEMSFFWPMHVNPTQQSNIALVSLFLSSRSVQDDETHPVMPPGSFPFTKNVRATNK